MSSQIMNIEPIQTLKLEKFPSSTVDDPTEIASLRLRQGHSTAHSMAEKIQTDVTVDEGATSPKQTEAQR